MDLRLVLPIVYHWVFEVASNILHGLWILVRWVIALVYIATSFRLFGGWALLTIPLGAFIIALIIAQLMPDTRE